MNLNNLKYLGIYMIIACILVLFIVGIKSNKLAYITNSWLGTPYEYGGITRAGIDCSGLVVKVFEQMNGVVLPYSVKELNKLGERVNKNKLLQGDLVFFCKNKRPTHVGIYMGNNVFVHASSTKGVIRSRLDNYWNKTYCGARRLYNE